MVFVRRSRMAKRKTDTLHRLLDIAAEMFIAHRYEDVSVSAIARAARCSTATIYEIYGNKQGLLLSVMQERLLPQPVTTPAGTPGLATLLQYVEARLDVVYRTGHAGLVRTALRQPEAVGEMFAKFARANRDRHEHAITALIEGALAEGTLRALPAAVIFEHIEAMAHLPALQILLLGVESTQPAHRILFDLFLPLVSDTGANTLEQHLAARLQESRQPADHDAA